MNMALAWHVSSRKDRAICINSQSLLQAFKGGLAGITDSRCIQNARVDTTIAKPPHTEFPFTIPLPNKIGLQ